METKNTENNKKKEWEKMIAIESSSEDSKVAEIRAEINQLENFFTRKKISVIGLSDQIGYSPIGYNYIDQIIHSIKFQLADLTVFNAHFQTFNREQDIENFIASNISLKEIKRIQHQENEEKIKNILTKKHLPPDGKLITIMRQLLKLREDPIRKNDSQIKLRDVLNQQDVNIFYSSNTGCIDENTSQSYINQQQEQRKRNYDYILSNNNNAQIYALGLITLNNHSDKKAIALIEKQNNFYQKLSSEFGTIYVDTDGLESTIKGNNLTEYGMTNLALRCIKAMYVKKIQYPKNINLEIIQPPITNSNQGIDYLLQKSIEKRKSSLIQQDIELEEQHVKIYKKIKADHFE